jgi:hypothetical protein
MKRLALMTRTSSLEALHEAEHLAHGRHEVDRHSAADRDRELAPRVHRAKLPAQRADEAIAGAEAGGGEIPVRVGAVRDSDVRGLDRPAERLACRS